MCSKSFGYASDTSASKKFFEYKYYGDYEDLINKLKSVLKNIHYTKRNVRSQNEDGSFLNYQTIKGGIVNFEELTI